MTTNLRKTRALLACLLAAVLTAGLVVLVGAGPAWAALGFASPPNSPFAVGTAPTTVTSADFDKDGNTDLATSNYSSDGISVLLGDGAGDFEEVTGGPVSADDAPTSVASADFNGDTNADLAVSNETSHNVSVLLGNGDGTFLAKPDLAVGNSPTSVVSADLNDDGDADLAVSNLASNTVSVMLGNGDGTFQTAQPYSVAVGGSPGPNQIITDDFDGDGVADLATANVGQNIEIANFHGGVTVLLGNGDGTFQSARRVARVFLNYSLASADFDGDGDKDLVATSYGMTGGCCIYGEVQVVLGNGDGTFGTPRFIRVGSGHTGPSAVASADLDRDGHGDLVVSNSASDDVSVMPGRGDGTFGAAQNFPAGDLPAFVISPDLDADGVADLAVANQASDDVSVLLNTAPPPPPDTDAPTSTHTLSAQPNAAGWHKSNVTVNLSATDTGGSGVKEIRYSATGAQSISETVYNPQSPPVINIEGITTLSYYATDKAGNAEAPKTFTVRLDKTVPQITPSDVVSNVWRNSPLSAEFTASDSGSGLANSTDASFALTASEESGGANQPTVASRTVLDRAGNSTTRKVSALIDLSEPQTTASSTPQPNANGWNASNVTVVLNATDAGGSGIRNIRFSATGAQPIAQTTYDPQDPPIITTEGTTTITYFATDDAGNRESPAKTFTVKLDKSAPALDTDNSDGTDGITPNKGQTGVRRNTNPAATFSDMMDPASLGTSIRLDQWNAQQRIWQRVPTRVSVAGKTATLDPYPSDPSRLLAANKRFKVTVTTGAKNLAGLPMSSPRSWTFSTGTR